jgi:prepilin-type N-terminal cleavage/methylation domain-containing protein
MANVEPEVETSVKCCWMVRRQSGFSLIEVVLVVAIMGILAVLATPMFLTYYQGAQLRVAAEEVATFLNHGRQLGIKENVGVCVQITATAMYFRIGDCVGAIWVGPGTDGAGNVSLPQGVTLTTTADPVFTYLGAANPAATYTVTNTQTAATLQVKLAASGRVCIAPSTSCP